MEKRHPSMLLWSLLLGVVAIGVLGVPVGLWLRQHMKTPASAESGNAKERVGKKRVVSRFDSPAEVEALDLLKQGLAIRDPSDVPQCFHLGSASADEVVAFLSRMEGEDGTVVDMRWLGSMDANGMLLDGVLVKTNDGKDEHSRLAFLTPDETGVWKIDFDAYARTVRPSWSELLEGGADEGLVRVAVAPDSYYNGPFLDESEWACFGMASPETDVVMLGYCRKGSPQERALARIVLAENRRQAPQSVKRATLKIRRIEGADSRQFEISRVMAEDWVMSADPYDGNFQ